MTIEAIPEERRLPVWPVVKRSYSYVWNHRVLLTPPLLLAFAVRLSSVLYLRNTNLTSISGILQHYAIVFADTIFSISVIVGIHRTILLGEIKSGFHFLRWDNNLLRYVGTFIIFILFGSLLYSIVIFLTSLLSIFALLLSSQNLLMVFVIEPVIGILVGSVLFVRFMLARPSAAVGDKDCLGISWSATHECWLNLVAIVFLTALPFIAPQVTAGIPQIVQDLHGGEMIRPTVAALIAKSLIRTIDLAVLTVMLSLTYDILVRGGQPLLKPPN